MKKAIFTTFVALWMGVIFWFSAQPAVESSKMSHSIGKVIGEVLVPDFKALSSEEQEAIAEKIDYPVRKTAHAMEYAVLVLMYGSYEIIGKKGMAYGILTGVAYAMTDEIHQLFVAGRSCQVTDVLIDSAGVIFGSIIGVLIFICTIKQRSR